MQYFSDALDPETPAGHSIVFVLAHALNHIWYCRYGSASRKIGGPFKISFARCGFLFTEILASPVLVLTRGSTLHPKLWSLHQSQGASVKWNSSLPPQLFVSLSCGEAESPALDRTGVPNDVFRYPTVLF